MTAPLKVDFPDRQGKDPLYAHGRNGYFEATAISIMPVHDYIVVENWTSKGAIGRGRVMLPADRNTIRDVANYLHRVADKLP
ncbi:MAG: hypothetical protein J0H31_29760 [Alphaproteobacteria bacterium]|nr:hypothetical protein [Alphaproteobacteria bacterium]